MYYIGAIADIANVQPETDETNNALAELYIRRTCFGMPLFEDLLMLFLPLFCQQLSFFNLPGSHI